MTVRLPRLVYRAIGTILSDQRVSAFHRRLYDRSAGRGGVGNALGVPIILLTTTGRVSGATRTTPVVAIHDRDGWLVVGSNGGRAGPPAWVHNLRAEPRCFARYRTQVLAAIAHEAVGDERERVWRVVTTAYPGFAVYQERAARPIPVFVLEPA